VKQIKDGKQSHLSGELTEKQCILFVPSKIVQARIECDQMEKIDAVGGHQMFGDDDMNFDLQLEKFGIDMGALKASLCFGCGWKTGKKKHRNKLCS
jgi:hypothetical protein